MYKFHIAVLLLFMVPALCMEKKISVGDLAQALSCKNETVVQAWLKSALAGEVDVNNQGECTHSALELLCSYNRLQELQKVLTIEAVRIVPREIFGYAAAYSPDCLRLLVHSGKYDPNEKDANGRTPLIFYHENRPVVEELLKVPGIEVNGLL